MVYKQPALGSAILWGDGILYGNILVKDNTILWTSGVRVHTTGVCQATASTWLGLFADPTSMTDSTESTLVLGESSMIRGLRVGPAGSWLSRPIQNRELPVSPYVWMLMAGNAEIGSNAG